MKPLSKARANSRLEWMRSSEGFLARLTCACVFIGSAQAADSALASEVANDATLDASWRFYHNEAFDQWGRPFVRHLSEQLRLPNGEGYSLGANGIDERGLGDDVVVTALDWRLLLLRDTGRILIAATIVFAAFLVADIVIVPATTVPVQAVLAATVAAPAGSVAATLSMLFFPWRYLVDVVPLVICFLAWPPSVGMAVFLVLFVLRLFSSSLWSTRVARGE